MSRSQNTTKHTIRRLTQAALFSAVRGLSYAAGSTTIAFLVWWLHNR